MRQSGQKMQLQPKIHLAGFQANRSDEHINPLITAEALAAFQETLVVETGKLDGAQVFNVKGVVVIIDIVMANSDFSPNATL